MDEDVVPFDVDSVKAYLDECIGYWRIRRGSGSDVASYYIDAFQSVRMSLFGECLPIDTKSDDCQIGS